VAKKKWREYTEKEINDNKRGTCATCIYHARIGVTSKYSKREWMGAIYCAYILLTGHKRNCDPMNCKKYVKITKETPKLRMKEN